VLILSQPSTLRSSVNKNQMDQNMPKLKTNYFYCPIFLAAMFLNPFDCNINVESWTMLVFLEVPQRLVLVLAGCPIAAVCDGNGFTLRFFLDGDVAGGWVSLQEVGPWCRRVGLGPAPTLPVVSQRQSVSRGGDVRPGDLDVGQGGDVLQSLGVAPTVGNLEHIRGILLVVLGEEKNVPVKRVDCHGFAVTMIVRISNMDVLDILGADHDVLPVPVLRHLWLLKLVDGERGPGKEENGRRQNHLT